MNFLIFFMQFSPINGFVQISLKHTRSTLNPRIIQKDPVNNRGNRIIATEIQGIVLILMEISSVNLREIG
jgi:hypothetical protein